MGRILRVFPRRNKATPEDEYAITEYPGLFMPDDVQEVHVSCAFTYDLERAYDLAEAWSKYYPVKLGGQHSMSRAGNFNPECT